MKVSCSSSRRETIVELADKLEHTFTDQKDVNSRALRTDRRHGSAGRADAGCPYERIPGEIS